MGNIVTNEARSDLAETDRQREFAAWFASNDHGVFGLGTVGFDLSELPWSPETFAADREFVLRVIDAARARMGWERLGYRLREERLQPSLDQFRALVEAFGIEHASGVQDADWPYGRPTQLVRCPVYRCISTSTGACCAT
jgi:hypothetical protein